MANYDYTVVVRGNDWSPEYGWSDEHYPVCEIRMNNEDEAIEYLMNITKEQALEWERESECNGLDILVYLEERDENGALIPGFKVSNMLGECEWIGDKLNGVWLGDGEERIDPIVKE